jgi:hypothetical protein
MSATSQSQLSSLEPAAPKQAASKQAAAKQAAAKQAASQWSAPIFNNPGTFWTQHREASLNWLAFGLLLAAWNAAGDDTSGARRRPDALRGYSSVSVRAAQRSLSHNP